MALGESLSQKNIKYSLNNIFLHYQTQY